MLLTQEMLSSQRGGQRKGAGDKRQAKAPIGIAL